MIRYLFFEPGYEGETYRGEGTSLQDAPVQHIIDSYAEEDTHLIAYVMQDDLPVYTLDLEEVHETIPGVNGFRRVLRWMHGENERERIYTREILSCSVPLPPGYYEIYSYWTTPAMQRYAGIDMLPAAEYAEYRNLLPRVTGL